MNEDFVYQGFWFLPSAPNSKVAGILSYSPHKSIVIELIGGFDNNSFGYVFRTQREPVIWGVTYNGEKISLLNCVIANGTKYKYSAEFPYIKFQCQYILKGYYLENIETKCFDRVRLFMPFLDIWFYPNQLNLKSIDKSNDIVNSLTEEIAIADGWKMVLHCSSQPEIKNFGNTIQLNQKTYCEIVSTKDKVDLSTLFAKMQSFVEFVNFAALSHSKIEKIILGNEDDESYHKSGINCYYIEPKFPVKNITLFNQFLFQFEKIAYVFPEVIRKWYELSSDIAPIRSHLISSIRIKDYFESLDYLIVVQALEGFHRRFINSAKISLKKRLEALFMKFSDIERINKMTIDFETVVQSRDYYSHFFNKNEKPQLLEGCCLYQLMIKLRLLLICCTLNLIGFDNEMINKLLNECKDGILQV